MFASAMLSALSSGDKYVEFNNLTFKIKIMLQHTDLYEVSKDYKRLFKLIAIGHRIVCFVDYNDKAKFRDVAIYRGLQKYCNTWELTGRGISYTQFDPKIDNQKDFIKDCERIDLEFIDQITKEEFKLLYEKQSVFKLDKNFHVYIHGDRSKMETGTDDKGQYMKLYFNRNIDSL